MRIQIGGNELHLHHTGYNHIPYIKGAYRSVIAPNDGPHAIFAKEYDSRLYLFHRKGTQIAKKYISNDELVADCRWIEGDVLVVLTTKGRVHMFSIDCQAILPVVSVVNTDLIRGFVTADYVIVQCDRTAVFVHSIKRMQEGKTSFCARICTDGLIFRAISQHRFDRYEIFMSHHNKVSSAHVENDGLVQLFSNDSLTDNPIEILKFTGSKANVCFYSYRNIFILDLTLTHCVAKVALENLQSSPLDILCSTNNLLIVPMQSSKATISILFMEIQGLSICTNHLQMHLNTGEKLIHCASEGAGVRIDTSHESFYFERQKHKVCYRDRCTEHSTCYMLWYKYFKQLHTLDVMNMLVSVLRVHGKIFSITDAAKVWMKAAQSAFDKSTRERAMRTAFFGMVYSDEDFSLSLANTRNRMKTLALLKESTQPMCVCADKLDEVLAKPIAERCIKMNLLDLASTITQIYRSNIDNFELLHAISIIKENKHSDKELMLLLRPHLASVRYADLQRVAHACQLTERHELLSDFCKELRKSSTSLPMLIKFYLSEQKLPDAIELAVHIGDLDSIVSLLRLVESTDSAFLPSKFACAIQYIVHFRFLLKKNLQAYSSSHVMKNVHVLLDLRAKRYSFLHRLHKAKSSEWESICSGFIAGLENFKRNILILRGAQEELARWLDASSTLLHEQYKMAVSTGNLAFIGKTFHETVVICHSYSQKDSIRMLARHFRYTRAIKFWLHLMHFCEVQDWKKADELILKAHMGGTGGMVPGVTELLWEYGRYFH